jgi:hypothetical protein
MNCDGLKKLRLRKRKSGTGYGAENTYEYERVGTSDKRRTLGAGAYKNAGGKRNSHLLLRFDELCAAEFSRD